MTVELSANRDNQFYNRLVMVVAAAILFGFAQWSARGMVDIPSAPIWVHLHGLGFVAFLILFLIQQQLAAMANLKFHRPLGWAGLILALALAALTSFASIRALQLDRIPPGFTNAFFLSVAQVEGFAFAGLVVAAVVKRRSTDWHRRLMLGALIILFDPALGRLLPGDLLGSLADPVAALIQLAVLAAAMRHDWTTHGRVHPAHWWAAATVLASHILFTLLSLWHPFATFADQLAVG